MQLRRSGHVLTSEALRSDEGHLDDGNDAVPFDHVEDDLASAIRSDARDEQARRVGGDERRADCPWRELEGRP